MTDDSVGRADAQESIRRAAEAQQERWDGKTVEEVRDEWMRRAKDRLNQILELEAERDRYRRSLERLRDLAAEGGNMDDGLWYRRLTKALSDDRVEAIRTLGRWARGDDCEHGYYAAGGTEFCPVCFPKEASDA